MLSIPNRLTELTKLIEEGKPITQAHINKAMALQSLDVAELDRQFVSDSLSRSNEQDDRIEQQEWSR